MIPYEDIIRKFRVDKHKEFTDIWTFPSVRPYKGKHPAEIPLDLLIHAIEATTYEDDIVLDFSAFGLRKTAIESGTCQWKQTKRADRNARSVYQTLTAQ